jgi:hypothetical protein
MSKFIIKYKSRIESKEVETFHSGISEARSESLVMNVYVEHISGTKENAKVFYTREEAQKICNLFNGPFHKGKVIKK